MKHRTIACIALLVGVLATPSASAWDGVVASGISGSRHVTPATTIWGQMLLPARAGNPWQWQPVASVGWINGRDDAGYEAHVLLAGGGARVRWVKGDGRVAHFFLEGQVFGASGRTQAISGGLQFGTAAGWTGQHWEVLLRHVSNAGLQGSNRGETMLMVGREL